MTEVVDFWAEPCADDPEMIEALGALHAAALSAAPGVAFDTRVLRRWRVRRTQATMAYWSPAVVGASVAAVALLAVLQVVANSRDLRPIPVPGAEVRHETWSGPFPELDNPAARTLVR